MEQKVFLFDIGNVLLDFDIQVLLDRIALDSGRPDASYSEADLADYQAVEAGAISDEEYVRRLNAAKGTNWSLETYANIWCDIFTVNPVGHKLFFDAVERGIPVYTLSNIAGYHLTSVEKIAPCYFKAATGLFLSYKMGVCKPDPKIYEMALAELGVKGEQCLFLDDLAANVAAARDAGIQAYQFLPENYETVQQAVREFFAS